MRWIAPAVCSFVLAILLTSPASAREVRSTQWNERYDARELGEEAAELAESYVGYPYVWGGSSPASGFDCSGLVVWVYGQLDVSVTHDTLGALAYGIPVAYDDLRAGDVIVFENTYAFGPSHAAIYLRDGTFVHAVDEDRGVLVSTFDNPYWSARFHAAARLFSDEAPAVAEPDESVEAATQPVDSGDSTEPVEYSEPVYSAEPIEVSEPVDSEEPIEYSDPADTAELVEDSGPMDSAEPVEYSEPADADSVEYTEPVDDAESVEYVETEDGDETREAEADHTDAEGADAEVATSASVSEDISEASNAGDTASEAGEVPEPADGLADESAPASGDAVLYPSETVLPALEP